MTDRRVLGQESCPRCPASTRAGRCSGAVPPWAVFAFSLCLLEDSAAKFDERGSPAEVEGMAEVYSLCLDATLVGESPVDELIRGEAPESWKGITQDA